MKRMNTRSPPLRTVSGNSRFAASPSARTASACSSRTPGTGSSWGCGAPAEKNNAVSVTSGERILKVWAQAPAPRAVPPFLNPTIRPDKTMIQKYKKIGLTALACTLLGMNAAEAAVILTFAQNGPDVTATWSGTYDVPVGTLVFVGGNENTSTFDRFIDPRSGSGEILNVIGRGVGAGTPWGGWLANAGIHEPTVIPFGVGFSGSYTGQTFGFGRDVTFGLGNFLALPIAGGSGRNFPTTPGPYSPVGTMTFASTTLAAMGAANYDNTLAFTGTGSLAGSREIRFTTAPVPEPTTGLLSLLAVGGLTLRRRR